MDSWMDLATCYNLDGNGIPLGIKSMEPFPDQLKEVPTCPTCKGSLRDICRYGRIVRRALLDGGTKRFASWAQATYIPLAEEFNAAEQLLYHSEQQFNAVSLPPETPTLRSLHGKRGVQIQQILNTTILSARYAKMKKLRPLILRFRDKVQKDETPVEKVWHLVEAAHRRQGKATTETVLDSQVSLTTFQVMAESLLLRCDIALLADFLTQLDRFPDGLVDTTFFVDLSPNRSDCLRLIEAAQTSKNLECEVEGCIFYARYCALERTHAKSPATSETLKLNGEAFVDTVHDLCKLSGGNTRVEALALEIKAVAVALSGGAFVSAFTYEERMAALSAMRKEFSETGHWYTCRNGHSFTVGEGGMLMQTERCPTCGETTGGRTHQPAEGVYGAEDLEREFAGLQV